MSWDTYIIIGLVSLAFGFYLVKSFHQLCPKCQAKLIYQGATDPKSEDKNFKNLVPGLLKPSAQEDRIQFHYQCPECQTRVSTQGRRKTIH